MSDSRLSRATIYCRLNVVSKSDVEAILKKINEEKNPKRLNAAQQAQLLKAFTTVSLETQLDQREINTLLSLDPSEIFAHKFDPQSPAGTFAAQIQYSEDQTIVTWAMKSVASYAVRYDIAQKQTEAGSEKVTYSDLNKKIQMILGNYIRHQAANTPKGAKTGVAGPFSTESKEVAVTTGAEENNYFTSPPEVGTPRFRC